MVEHLEIVAERKGRMVRMLREVAVVEAASVAAAAALRVEREAGQSATGSGTP